MLSAVAGVLMSVGLGAQGRNFSGSWVIDAEKSSAANSAMAGGRGGGGGGMRSAGGGDAGAMIAAVGGRGGGGAVGAGGGMRSGGGGIGGAVVGTPGLSITVDANTLTVVNGAATTTYRLDGSVTALENPMRKTTAKASWQGDKITIETTAEGPAGPVVTHTSWYLEGDSLVRENKSTGPDGQDVVRKTYYKRS
jgi:hypothetical protein